jgi:uncharacterized protein (TIGR04255 family)
MKASSPSIPNPNEIYPHSPLREVVAEIRFGGEIAIETKRDLFFEKVRDKYPDVYVPQNVPGKSAALQAYQFEDPDKERGTALAINRFAFYERSYSGHEAFIGEFLRLANLVSEFYGVDKLNRVGWRYINIIPFVRQRQIIRVGDVLNLALSVGEEPVRKFHDLNLEWVSPADEGVLITRLQSATESPSKQEILKLDFDSFATEELSMGNLRETTTLVHNHARLMFERMITNEYRQYLRGEGIE